MSGDDEADESLIAGDLPDARTVRTGGRIGRMMVAAAAGWVLGFVVTAPVKVHDVVLAATGDERLLAVSMAQGLITWAVITLGLAIVFLLLLLGPLATLISARWVVRHPRLAVVGLPVLFLLPCGNRLIAWLQVEPGPWVYPMPLFGDYMVFGLVFLAAASVLYLRLLRRGVGVAGVDVPQ